MNDGAVSSERSATSYRIGDLVALRSDPGTVAPVIEVVPGGAETRYRVFQDNRAATYYESQLRDPDRAGEPERLSADGLRACLTGLHLLSPSASSLYSLGSGRIHFVPCQYRPVPRPIRADRPRLLINVGEACEASIPIVAVPAAMTMARPDGGDTNRTRIEDRRGPAPGAAGS